MKVKIRSGNINIAVDRDRFPSDSELGEILKDYLGKTEAKELGVGDLTLITSGRGRNAKTYFISTESLLKQAGVEVHVKN